MAHKFYLGIELYNRHQNLTELQQHFHGKMLKLEAHRTLVSSFLTRDREENLWLTRLEGMRRFLRRSLPASISLWISLPTASSGFAACVSIRLPTPLRNSTTPTLAAPGNDPTPVTKEKHDEIQGGEEGAGIPW